jgi:hypothetical protein
MVATPDAYPWCGHAALRAEDRAVLDLHPLYCELCGSPAERYSAYLQLVAEEADRPAISLAHVYFVGRRRFVGRMLDRFGLAGRAASFREVELADEIYCITPAPSGKRERETGRDAHPTRRRPDGR